MDYVDDILLPGEEIGMRVDNDFIYAPTVCVVKKIDVFNLKYVLSSIGFTGLNRC
jgi:hypothetical protein